MNMQVFMEMQRWESISYKGVGIEDEYPYRYYLNSSLKDK